jgi:cytosine/uracil/thiamine/allantoin permease
MASSTFGNLALALLPLALSSADLWRFARPTIKRAGKFTLTLSLAPVLFLWGALGALLSSAAQTKGGEIVFHPISDAVGFGGQPAAALAGLLTLLAWGWAMPFVGFYSASLALAALPGWTMSYRRASKVLLALALGGGGLLVWQPTLSGHLNALLALGGAPLGVLVIDEVVVRRGRLLLEDAYIYDSQYGSVFGVSFAGAISLLLGWSLHPWFWQNRASGELGAALRAAVRMLFGDPHSVHPIAAAAMGFGIAAVVYVLLAPIERVFSRWLRKRRKRRAAPRSKRFADARTDPHFDP